ncbi:pitrilysin family protein [Methyloligella sp. 2.7D]|uniref:M16 family metallopeptidase n=1 Tax=unclassified Methyloligella TaxID=2625955 RepID=UPI00157C30AC|nr:pitrilysin family protein [Methyloligella sp. GL2]QKP78324.1 insulinase family protein [Methyloligella sp. GL2]
MTPSVSKLANGITVVTAAMPGIETVSLGVWIGAGSRSETLAEHGVAHFLEHMAFKGTARRSARDIAEEIEAVGGDLNAATAVDSTAYHARVMRQDVPLAMDILSDILLNARFDELELARERDVILQEIAASLDSPDDTVFDLVQEAAYPDQPMGRPILGTSASVSRFTREDLSRYLTAHYHGPSMVLAAAGAVDHAAFLALAERYFGGVEASPAGEPEAAHYVGGIRSSQKSFEQSHLALSFEAPAFLHEDYFKMQMLAALLGGGMSSRLFQEVREKRGLCYSVFAYAYGLSDGGLFNIYAATGPERADQLFAVLREEIVRGAEEGFHEDELARVRAQVKMGLLTALESSGARADQLARQLLVLGRTIPNDEAIERIEAVSLEDVRRQAEKLLASPLSLATVGPVGNQKRFDAVAAQFVSPPSRAA